MAKYQFGFIGTGNMGGALATAVCRRIAPEQVILSNRTPAKAEDLAGRLGCAITVDNRTVAKNSTFLFLGVKPQMMAALLEQIGPVLKKRTDRFVLVSMAAGLTCEQVARMAGGDYPVIRIMPNTPVSVGRGVILYTHSQPVAREELEQLCAALADAGTLDELPESLMDAGSALSGCGPAFVYQFLEALADGGVECGLPRDKAVLYAARTLEGAAALVLESGSHPAALKDAVCSPGGSTIAGVHALESHGARGAVMDAVCAAFRRTRQLGS